MPRAKKDREVVRTPFVEGKHGVRGTPSNQAKSGRVAYAASSVIERGTADKIKAAVKADEKHLCLCGCGQEPSQIDSLFMPGHDSKVRSMGKAVKEGRIDASAIYAPARKYLEQGGML